MTQGKKQISPLCQRMIDEMNMRKLKPRTQISYLRAVDKLAKYLKYSPEHATSAQLREFQIALTEQGASNFTMNGTITGLQFLFAKTSDRPDVVKRLCRVPVPRKLPTVLSVDEVKRLIDACHSPKYTTALGDNGNAGACILASRPAESRSKMTRNSHNSAIYTIVKKRC